MLNKKLEESIDIALNNARRHLDAEPALGPRVESTPAAETRKSIPVIVAGQMATRKAYFSSPRIEGQDPLFY